MPPRESPKIIDARDIKSPGHAARHHDAEADDVQRGEVERLERDQRAVAPDLVRRPVALVEIFRDRG